MKYVPQYSFAIQDLPFYVNDTLKGIWIFGPVYSKVICFKGVEELGLGFSIRFILRVNASNPQEPFITQSFNSSIDDFLDYLVNFKPSCLFKMEAPIQTSLSADANTAGTLPAPRTRVFFNYYEGIISEASVYDYNALTNEYDLDLTLSSRVNLLDHAQRFCIYRANAKTDTDPAAGPGGKLSAADTLAGTRGVTFSDVVHTLMLDNNLSEDVDYTLALDRALMVDGKFIQPARIRETSFGVGLLSNYLSLDGLSEAMISRHRFRVQADETDLHFLTRICESEGVVMAERCIEWEVQSDASRKAFVDRVDGIGPWMLHLPVKETGRGVDYPYLDWIKNDLAVTPYQEGDPNGVFAPMTDRWIALPIYQVGPEEAVSEKTQAEFAQQYQANFIRQGVGMRLYRSAMIITDTKNPVTKEVSLAIMTSKPAPGATSTSGQTTTAVSIYYPMTYSRLTDQSTADIRDLVDEFSVTKADLPRSVSIANYSEYSDHMGITYDFAPIEATAFTYRDPVDSTIFVSLQPPVGVGMAPPPDVDAVRGGSIPFGRGDVFYYGEAIQSVQDARRVAVRRLEMHLAQASIISATGYVMDARAGGHAYLSNRGNQDPKSNPNLTNLTSCYFTKVAFRGCSSNITLDPQLRKIFNLLQGDFYRGDYEILNVMDNVAYRPPLRTKAPKIYGEKLALLKTATLPDAMEEEYFVDDTKKDTPLVVQNTRGYSPQDRFGRYALTFTEALASSDWFDPPGYVDPDVIHHGSQHQNPDPRLASKYYLGRYHKDALPALRKREFGADGMSYGGATFSVEEDVEVLVGFSDGNPDMPFVSAFLPKRQKEDLKLTKFVGMRQATYLRSQGGSGLFLVDHEGLERAILEVAPPPVDTSSVSGETNAMKDVKAGMELSLMAKDLPMNEKDLKGVEGDHEALSYLELFMPPYEATKSGPPKSKGAGIRYGTEGILIETALRGKKTTLMTKGYYHRITQSPSPSGTLDSQYQKFGPRMDGMDKDVLNPNQSLYSFVLSDMALISATMQFVAYTRASEKDDEVLLRPYKKLYPNSVPGTERVTAPHKKKVGSAGSGEGFADTPAGESEDLSLLAYGSSAVKTGDIPGIVNPVAGIEGEDDKMATATGTFTRELGPKYQYRLGNDYVFAKEAGVNTYSFGSRYQEYHITYSPRTSLDDPSDQLVRRIDPTDIYPPEWVTQKMDPELLKPLKVSDYFHQETAAGSLPDSKGEERSGKSGYVRRFYGNRVKLIDGTRSDVVTGDVVTHVGGTSHLITGHDVDLEIGGDAVIETGTIELSTRFGGEYRMYLNNPHKTHISNFGVVGETTVDMNVTLSMPPISKNTGVLYDGRVLGTNRCWSVGTGPYAEVFLQMAAWEKTGEISVGIGSFENFLNYAKLGLLALGGSVVSTVMTLHEDRMSGVHIGNQIMGFGRTIARKIF